MAARDLPVQTSPVVVARPERAYAAAFSARDAVDLNGARKRSEHKKTGRHAGRELRALTYKAWKAGISGLLIFEGWDAAGQGRVHP